MKFSSFRKVPVPVLMLGEILSVNGANTDIKYREVNSVDGKVLKEGKLTCWRPIEEIDVDETRVDGDGYAPVTNFRRSLTKGWLVPKAGQTIDRSGYG